MKSIESANLGESIPLEELQSILRKYPIRLTILFGSHATGRTHLTSDVDIAVEFESIEHNDPTYNDVFFGLSADLSDGLETDNVDLVDIESISPGVAEAILEEGVLLVGEQEWAENLLSRKANSSTETRTPHERFDAAIEKIDEHLDTDSTVRATDRSRDER